jgi:hypothetical protein
LTPAKLAGDIVKPVVTGLAVVGSVALAVGTGGASAAAEVAAEGAAEGAAEAAAEGAAASVGPSIFNPAFEDAGAFSVDALSDTGTGLEDDLFEDTFSEDLTGGGSIFANPALEGPVEETAEEVAEGTSRTGKLLSAIKNAGSKTLKLAGRGAKKVGLLAKKAFKNPFKAFIVYELGKSTVNDITDAIREASNNYDTEGRNEKYILQVIAASERYQRFFDERNGQCPSSPASDGDGNFIYPFGDDQFILYDAQTRGDEYSKFIHQCAYALESNASL